MAYIKTMDYWVSIEDQNKSLQINSWIQTNNDYLMSLSLLEKWSQKIDPAGT